METYGSMDDEQAPKPFKHLTLQKERNRMSDDKGMKYMRFYQNLKHLADAHQMIKGKVYDVVISRDPANAIDLLRHC